MVELVVLSGKGGTGKTSVTAALAALAEGAVIADCDVDAPDLHMLLAPRVVWSGEFRSGHAASIRQEDCTRCGACAASCRFEAVRTFVDAEGRRGYRVDPTACEGCGVCVRFCPARAVDFRERICGIQSVSSTRFGPMVHALLEAGAESSGKLVTWVRQEARRVAEAQERGLILVDGPPGIGCPVIASVTGASRVLAVTEPTVSGAHDLARFLELARHFEVPCAVCVNKWDLSPAVSGRIEEAARAAGAAVLPRIPYDRRVTAAQREGKTVIEYGGPAGQAIAGIWEELCRMNR